MVCGYKFYDLLDSCFTAMTTSEYQDTRIAGHTDNHLGSFCLSGFYLSVYIQYQDLPLEAYVASWDRSHSRGPKPAEANRN